MNQILNCNSIKDLQNLVKKFNKEEEDIPLLVSIIKDSNGNNLFHLSIIKKNKELVSYLVNLDHNKILKNSTNYQGNTALHLSKDTDITLLLLKNNYNPFMVNNNKNIPFNDDHIKKVFIQKYFKVI